MIQTLIQIQNCVYENDYFEYEYGLEPKLIRRPVYSEKGEPTYFYGIYKTANGGYGFSVMSKSDIDANARSHSKGFESAHSPWKTAYEEMAKKTVVKQALKYSPIKTEFQQALSTDYTVKSQISEQVCELPDEFIAEVA